MMKKVLSLPPLHGQGSTIIVGGLVKGHPASKMMELRREIQMPSSSAGLLNSVLYWFLQLTHCSCSQTYFYHAVLRGVLFSII